MQSCSSSSPFLITVSRALTNDDDRAHFDCGRESLNAWFQRHAWHNHVSGISRINVIGDTGTGRIVGYVTLSAAQIERAFLAQSHQRNKPDPIACDAARAIRGR